MLAVQPALMSILRALYSCDDARRTILAQNLRGGQFQASLPVQFQLAEGAQFAAGPRGGGQCDVIVKVGRCRWCVSLRLGPTAAAVWLKLELKQTDDQSCDVGLSRPAAMCPCCSRSEVGAGGDARFNGTRR